MHTPVLLNEVLESLDPQPGDVVADGTASGGGHMEALLERMRFCGTYLAIDWDKEILQKTRERITAWLEKAGIATNGLRIVWSANNYRNLPLILEENSIPSADKLLLDLGFSSEHIVSGRGFSYKDDMAGEPLDMRYSTDTEATAADVVNSLRENELADIFWQYGEERFSRNIARQIVAKRKEERIVTVGALVECIRKAVPNFYRKGTAAVVSRTFQALRIYVNGELNNLTEIVEALPGLMSKGGRAAIISFHSLEDRIVKNAFRELGDSGRAEALTKRPIAPSESEVAANPRSRSAKLRTIVFKK